MTDKTSGFNTQPPEGGCVSNYRYKTSDTMFQHTATRRWLLAKYEEYLAGTGVSTHSHPKVAALPPPLQHEYPLVSTHSHPKVAAYNQAADTKAMFLFQHTATRRWLLLVSGEKVFIPCVSTHSHPKVAAH